MHRRRIYRTLSVLRDAGNDALLEAFCSKVYLGNLTSQHEGNKEPEKLMSVIFSILYRSEILG